MEDNKEQFLEKAKEYRSKSEVKEKQKDYHKKYQKENKDILKNKEKIS
jgi:hypothetical protein